MNVIYLLVLWFAVSAASAFFGGRVMRLNQGPVVNGGDRVPGTDARLARNHPLAA